MSNPFFVHTAALRRASLVHRTAALVKTLLRFFFRLLYHQFAFTYDLVAATVSFNRWQDWVMSVLPFVDGKRVLEMGHGPGHLQRILLSRNLVAVGIDESAQMGRLAKRNLRRGTLSQSRNGSSPRRFSPGSASAQNASTPHLAYAQANLTRGVAQQLPFPNETFDTIIATFPTEYITDPGTLAEVRRCLLNGGRLVVLPVALPKHPFLIWLFKVTDQSPTEALEVVKFKFKEPFAAAGFETEIKTLDVKSGILLIVLATNPMDPPERTLSPLA
ncbi:MAG: methyltransferase domain-containing protein [Chloroflexi bacterium]|nr:MAG: methyltransferase domain-containing protein [Chloroflexota bacterium]